VPARPLLRIHLAPACAGGRAAALAAWLAVVALSVAAAQPAAAPPASGGLQVELEQGDGTLAAGRLERIDSTEVRLAAGDGAVVVPLEQVRAVRRSAAAGAAGDTDKLVLTLVDGSTLAATDFSWDGKGPAVLERPEGRIELPAARVRSIAWRAAGGGGAAPRWQGTIPEGSESDLLVVGTDENHEFVECAIASVSADAVTVVLDEETIPVKRAKVIGMQWLRPTGPEAGGNGPGRIAVAVDGGSLRAGRVEWTAGGLVVDGDIRVPAPLLAGIDYAAGRMVGLATLPAEKVDVEPWFGGLGRNAGLAAFFAPRSIGPRGAVADSSGQGRSARVGGAGVPSLIMRPRTVAVWRLPPDSRRFRAAVAAAAGVQAADAVVVAVAVDDRELFRRQVDASAGDPPAGIPIDVDVTSGRRLTVTVDFAGGVGGAVRFTGPVIER
jgi:hypothetical protein